MTNNSRLSTEEFAAKFEKLGLGEFVQRPGLGNMWSAVTATQHWFMSQPPHARTRKAFVLGHQGLKRAIEACGVVVANPSQVRTDYERAVTPEEFAARVHPDKAIGAVVLGFDEAYCYHDVAFATACLLENPGCAFLATNRDYQFPCGGRKLPGNGSETTMNFDQILCALGFFLWLPLCSLNAAAELLDTSIPILFISLLCCALRHGALGSTSFPLPNTPLHPYSTRELLSAIVAAVATAVRREPDVVAGKPSPFILHAILAELGRSGSGSSDGPGDGPTSGGRTGHIARRTLVVGDMWSDVEFGHAAGCQVQNERILFNEGGGGTSFLPTLILFPMTHRSRPSAALLDSSPAHFPDPDPSAL